MRPTTIPQDAKAVERHSSIMGGPVKVALMGAVVMLAGCDGRSHAPIGDALPPDAPLSFDAPIDAPIEDAPPPVDASPDGRRDAFYPGCHYDCFGRLSCMAGVARAQIHLPIPCEYWTGSCPANTYSCTSGCATEFSFGMNTNLSIQTSEFLAQYCAEAPTAQPEDSCERLCLPQRAVETDGGLVTTHLSCRSRDEDAGGGRTCAVSAAPSPERYGDPCDRPGTSTDTGVEAFGCGYIPCLRVADPQGGCLRAGCTSHCVGDHECPSGSYCDFTTGWPYQPVCRAGPRGGAPTTWACVPDAAP